MKPKIITWICALTSPIAFLALTSYFYHKDTELSTRYAKVYKMACANTPYTDGSDLICPHGPDSYRVDFIDVGEKNDATLSIENGTDGYTIHLDMHPTGIIEKSFVEKFPDKKDIKHYVSGILKKAKKNTKLSQ